MRAIGAPDGIATRDRARDSAALLVYELVVVIATMPSLNPSVPRLAAAAGELELAEERLEDPAALLRLMVFPIGRLAR